VAPPPGAPLPRTGPNWQWVPIDGAVCRDGSPTGFFVKFSDASPNLMIYLEGGGACFNTATCTFTPHNIRETVVGETRETSRAEPRPQAPWTEGIFDTKNPANPVRDWSMVYPGVSGQQQFVGYRNMTRFLSRIIPTFSGANKVLLTGTSAGGVGAAANFNQAQDGFGHTPVILLDDSGPVFDDAYSPICMQKKVRDLWGLNGSLPPDCPDCFRADGGGLGAAAVFLQHKYPTAVAGFVSSLQDEVMRFFLDWGENDCQGGNYSRDKYTKALYDMRDHHGFQPAQFGTYFFAGRRHTHIFRDRFYGPGIGGVTLAQWTASLLAGKPARIEPTKD
jgi:hypothetical protein